MMSDRGLYLFRQSDKHVSTCYVCSMPKGRYLTSEETAASTWNYEERDEPFAVSVIMINIDMCTTWNLTCSSNSNTTIQENKNSFKTGEPENSGFSKMQFRKYDSPILLCSKK